MLFHWRECSSSSHKMSDLFIHVLLRHNAAAPSRASTFSVCTCSKVHQAVVTSCREPPIATLPPQFISKSFPSLPPPRATPHLRTTPSLLHQWWAVRFTHAITPAWHDSAVASSHSIVFFSTPHSVLVQSGVGTRDISSKHWAIVRDDSNGDMATVDSCCSYRRR